MNGQSIIEKRRYGLVFLILMMLAGPSQAFGASSAGYSEYYIPGNEENMIRIFQEVGAGDQGTLMHSVITITAWSANTTVYYDHWEDGYDFDPDNPATADETFTLSNRGDSETFESSNIPTNPRGTSVYYDGGDYIYVAGGATTVTRASWTETEGPNQSLAWEVYPVRPQLTTYILPFGEDLDPPLADFDRVYALIQATEDNTTVTVDYNGDGTPDPIDPTRDENCSDSVTSIILARGEVFLLDDHSICPTSGTLDTGTTVKGTETLQVQYVIGDEGTNFEIRGLSAFPRGFWDDEYYAPVDSAAAWRGDPTDIYLHNPHTTDLTINYETTAGSGTFTLSAHETSSFYLETGGYVPENSSVYLKGTDVFWGVSTIDVAETTHDWGYSLVPAFLLGNEHFMGWAPCSYPINMANSDDSGIFIAPAQDNIRIFVDRDNDGIAESTYDLDRLETQYVYDSLDGDMSDANIWATGPYALAYGQNPDTAADSNPALDVGYTTLPGIGFIELVLTVEKSADPVMMDTAIGSQSTFTLVVDSHAFSVDAINAIDTLPAGWQYVDDSTTITLPDKSQITGNAADPTITGGGSILTWANTLLGDMDENQEITIVFTAETTQVFSTGDLSRNLVEVSGTRTVETVTQTFTTTDFAFVAFGDLEIEKTSSGVDPLYPGDTYTYTVTVTNPADASGTLTGLALYDPLPDGIGYVPGTATVTVPAVEGPPIRVTEYYVATGDFTGLTYDLTLNQDLEQNYFLIIRGGAEGNATRGPDDNYPALTGDPWGTGDLSVSSGTDVIRLTRGGTSDDWVGVVTVVESVTDPTGGGFTLLDVQRVSHPAFSTGGTDNSAAAWSDINQVMLMGGFYGAGCNTSEPDSLNSKTCHARIWPSNPGNVINWSRDSGGATLAAATSTVMVLEWGSEWTVQRVHVTGSNGGDGADAVGEYNTGNLGSSVARDNTWVWGTGHTNQEGLGDGPEGVLVTLGDGVTQNPSESMVAVGIEYAGNAINFEVYALTHPNIDVDYRFKADGDGTANTVNVTVDTASSNSMALVYNGCNGTGPLYPRPIFSARYTASDTVELERGYSGQDFPAWVQGIDFRHGTPISASGNPPPNLVRASEGYSLVPGQTLQLTFQVTIDDPLATGIEEITNTAWVTCNEILLPLSDDATNIVVNPSSESATVGDRVWLDSDADGVQDVGEAGLANMEVTLVDEWGAPIDTAITDATGHYLFTNVEPGNDYYVELTAGLPAGLTQSAPSGHSDHRTDPFDLSAGDAYEGADLGYAPDSGTATFGDLVWSDADGDGVRDGVEPGLEGITVDLYLDVNGDGIFDRGSGDTLEASTTTAPGGSYLFTGITVTGTEDYFVFVDPAQAALSDYTPTTGDPVHYADVDSGDVLLTSDFGFENIGGTAYTIEDAVWLDSDGDGTQDIGESGISGVTVDLLDDSLNVIASTMTDGDGYFSFSGVPGNDADYTVRITDTGGVLNDYYGTTAEAVAHLMAINDLDSDLDYTSNPNFGYNISKSIGDTVFNDIDGDGSQDAGEPGISSVSAALYLDDGDGTFEPGTDDTLVAAKTTDASGKYLFSGLADGIYFVHVDNTQAALTGYDTLTTSDDDAAAGHQREVTVSGGTSVVDADFGYQVTVDPRTASGTLWEDENGDGLIDVGEPRFENVTLVLYLDDGDDIFEPDSDDTLVTTTSSDANGDYTFTGLPPDSYWVYVTDDTSVLNGYETTYETTEQTTSPFNDFEAVDLSSGDQTDLYFGYQYPVPTLAIVSSFRAYEDGGEISVEWETAAEIGTVGFYLYRKDEAGNKYVRLNQKLLPGLLVSPQGGTYRYVDETAMPGKTYTYKLVEVEATGKRRSYGPFTMSLGQEGLGPAFEGATPGRRNNAGGSNATTKARIKDSRLDLNSQSTSRVLTASEVSPLYSYKAHEISGAKQARLENRNMARAGAALSRSWRVGSRIKIAVSQDGLYYLDAAEISDLFGLRLRKTKRLIAGGGLSLSNQGAEVAYIPAQEDSGIYFYAEGIDSIYTRENIYWLEQGRGVEMGAVIGDGPGAAWGHETFDRTVHAEEDRYPATGLFSDPEEDYWLWDFIIAGGDQKAFAIRSDGASGDSRQAMLTVYLKGICDDPDVSPDHHVVVSVNGTQIGGGFWEGTAARKLELPFDQGLLNDGENAIQVRGLLDTGAAYSYFYVDSFDLTYPCLYQARDNRLFFRGDENPVVTISGFTSPDILVFDVTDPKRVKLVEAKTIEPALEGYGVSIEPASPDALYLAVTTNAATLDLTLWADTPSSLTGKNNGADYLVIAPAELKNGADRLADYRAGDGLLTMVVDLEDVMDEFNHGIYTPHAIRDFLSYAYEYWDIPPRYVVLTGDGAYDYKDNLGCADNLVPPLMVATPYGLFASDNRFADVAGDDGVPEMAVGRLPVLTEEELGAVIDKIIAYESAGGEWTSRVLMLADNADVGGNFPSDSDDVARLIPPGYVPEKIYLSKLLTVGEARQRALAAINEGAVLVNYIGHAALDRLADEGLLLDSDTDLLSNGDRLPVMTAMTCGAGRFAIPGYDVLGEAFVLKEADGAIAFWAPTGMSINAEAKILDEAFFQSALSEKGVTLGTAILGALEVYSRLGSERFMLEVYNLLGDPALQMK